MESRPEADVSLDTMEILIIRKTMQAVQTKIGEMACAIDPDCSGASLLLHYPDNGQPTVIVGKLPTSSPS